MSATKIPTEAKILFNYVDKQQHMWKQQDQISWKR